MKLKDLFKPVIAAVFLGFCFLYALGCGGSSGGTTSNPLGAGSGALILTGKVVTTDIFPSQIIANSKEDLLNKDLKASSLMPIPGADVWLEKHPLIYAKTNASGVYQLDGVPEGEHNIVAKAYNNSRSTIYKMRVNAKSNSDAPENKQSDILLKEAKNYVTGILRDSNGNPLPAGTNLTLWGESFTVGNDGKFTSPPLPEGFTEETIILPSNAFSDEVIIKAAFISDSAPPEIEVFVPEKGKPGNSAPIVFLSARKGGVPASKVSPNEQLTLTAEALDPDTGDASSLVVYWSSDKGFLATNSAQPFQAIWTAPDHPGMATIEIRIYDSHGAYGAVKLKILVGLDSPPTGPADTLSPTVETISPSSDAVNVAVSANTTVTFNELIATLTVNTNTFVLTSGGSVIAGSAALNPDGKSATFRPTEDLPAGAVITITFGGIKDLAGNPLIADVYTYTTAAEQDMTAPSVLAVVPVENATNIGIDSKITVAFSEAMDTASINATTFTVASGGVVIAGNISFGGDGIVATFTPSASLPTGALITVTVTTGAKDLSGNAMSSNKAWSFATIQTPDTTAPSVVSVVPVENATNIGVDSKITVTFSEVMDTPSINATTFTVASGGVAIAGNISFSGNGSVATFAPSVSLPTGALITVMVTTGAKDMPGNAMSSNKAWSFATIPTPDTTAPTNQDTVLAASVTVKGGTAVAIVSSGDANNAVWLAPAGTTVFVESATITKAGGTATLINAPADEGAYKLFVIDAAGNVSVASTATVTVDNTAPANQDTVLAASVTVKGGDAVTIVSSGDANNTVWLAPAGTTVFVESATITKAGGTATSINAPADEGAYKLFVIDAAGNVSAASTATVTVDNTAPANQDTVLAASVTVKGGDAVTIVSSGDANNTVWLAPAGTTVFVESATITKAGGTATSINAPANEGVFKLYVIDAVGNISNASVAGVTVDNTPPTVESIVPLANATNVPAIELITVTFSETMATSTINATSFTVASSGTTIAGNITYSSDGRIATFTPTTYFPRGSEIDVTLTTGAKDIAGNALISNTSWSFTTTSTWANVACGRKFTFSAMTDDTLWGWGSNSYGEMGTISGGPVNGTTWTRVACGNIHTLAIKNDGTLWGCGGNSLGQVGDGTNADRWSLVQIAGTSWSQVACGYWFTLAVKTDGTLWAWGDNTYGQLGDGTNTSSNSPVQIAGTTWAQVACGYNHALAVKTDGTLWTWGDNTYGQLGDGTTTSSNSPVQIAGTDWAQVACGYNHSFAIKTDGTLWVWGDNLYGQLGDGSVNNERHSPVQIAGTTWKQVSSGRYHTLAVKTDGTLWAWGSYQYGQLGDGTSGLYRGSQVQITGTTWAQVACGENHTLAVKTDGTLWAWGFNDYGQLESGLALQINSPVQVGQ